MPGAVLLVCLLSRAAVQGQAVPAITQGRHTMETLHPRCAGVASTSRPAEQIARPRERRSARCQATIALPVPAPETVGQSSNGSSNGVTHLNAYSRTVTQPKQQGGSQAMLYAAGLKEGDMDKPQARL